MTVQIGPISRKDEALLIELFALISDDETALHFHPHQLTPAEARKRSRYRGLDLYALVRSGRSVLAYGFLRGWDAGFAVPSVGLYVCPHYRRMGVAQVLMGYLHLAACLRGAPAIRLKVYHDNAHAKQLYVKLGYLFGGELEDGQEVGLLHL